jgi:hypothetical protein
MEERDLRERKEEFNSFQPEATDPISENEIFLIS